MSTDQNYGLVRDSATHSGLRLDNATTFSQADFLIQATQAHGQTYDYSTIIFTGRHHPVEIICRKHGMFKQIAASHINGSGCPKCSRERSTNIHGKLKESGKVWLYLFQCSGRGELFHKIGLTAAGVESRSKNIPYDIEVLFRCYGADYKLMRKVEKLLLLHFISFRYEPQKPFAGSQLETLLFNDVESACYIVREIVQAFTPCITIV